MAAQKSEVAKLREQIVSRVKTLREEIAPRQAELDEALALVSDEPEAKSEQAQPSSPAVAPRRARRKRQGGTREEQAIKFINENPGVSASDVAKALKIKPNYLYRVLGDAEKAGKVKKEGRSYHPVSA